MSYVCSYRPGYFSGFEDYEWDIKSLDELLALDWVKRFADSPDFAQFSYTTGGLRGPTGVSQYTLMKETTDGGWWVVAGIDESFGLPVWDVARCKARKKVGTNNSD